MRKLVVSMNLTLDGFIAGPNCELDWHFNYWNDEMAACMSRQLYDADTILLGRVTFNAMAKFWPMQANNHSLPKVDVEFAETINNNLKLVFSRTLQSTTWNNSRVVNGNLRIEVTALKSKEGKDIIVYGSGQLVASLAKLHLVDEYFFWLHPLFLGSGKPLFRKNFQRLSLIATRQVNFKSGVVLLCYRPVQD